MNLYADYTFYISEYRGNLTDEEFDKSVIPASAMSEGLPSGALMTIWKWKK
jgi:hypothetical protein